MVELRGVASISERFERGQMPGKVTNMHLGGKEEGKVHCMFYFPSGTDFFGFRLGINIAIRSESWTFLGSFLTLILKIKSVWSEVAWGGR